MLLQPNPDAVNGLRDSSQLGIPTGGRPAGPGTLRYTMENEAKIAGFAPVPNTGWTIVVERPASEVAIPAERSWRVLIGGIIGSTGLALLCAAWLARRLSRPVRELAAATHAFGEGNPNVPLPAVTSASTEIAALIESFTAMRTAILAREAALVQSEERLRQAHKMEAVGQLAGGVAHDFNNLLTAMIGFAELMRERAPADSLARGHADQIIHAGQRAAGLTRQLLAFGRRQILRPEILDLHTVVSETEQLLRRLIPENVVINTITTPGLGQVMADPTQVSQIIMNLAVNARDAMPEGGTLTIETVNVRTDGSTASPAATLPSGDYVMLAVRDTGTGMDEEIQAHLFEPFFTTKEVGKGTGLGLATVYGIVKQSGGEICVESRLGVGTTVAIYFPRVMPAMEPARIPVYAGPQGGTETIVVAEDEDQVRDVACTILRSAGYAVIEAPNGVEALAEASRPIGTVHLLVTDVVMPGLGGRELAAAFRALHPEAKVLYMSGYAPDAALRQDIVERDLPFLGKPFTSTELLRMVRDVLDQGATVPLHSGPGHS